MTRTVASVALALVTLGCGAAPIATQSPSPAPAQALECETGAFPCAFADVREAVRVETERLATEAIGRVNAGASNDELVAWLDSEESVAEVDGDADSVRFRPTDGRGVWITRPTQAVQPTALASDAVAYAGPWDPGAAIGGTAQTVTGEGRTERRALVLSPFRWEFTDSDDGQQVAERLREMPEYANGVIYKENATVSSTDVKVDDFRDWDELQVVHVVSHGMRLCKLGKCRAVLAANALPGATANIWPSAVRGLELEVQVQPPAIPKYNTLLGADFFRAEYPTGLGDTVVFLNGCATFGPGAPDLADAIRGNRSVVLGWDESVESYGAQAASLAMYEQLAGSGRTVGYALNQLGDLDTTQSQNIYGHTVFSTLSSTGRALGGDLRIRDVVSFRGPAGGPLSDGADVPLIGEPDDGAPDSVAWSLLVDGIDATEAASAMVIVTIDGVAAPSIAVSSGVAQGTGSWLLQGTVALGVDVSAPHPAQFEASLTLPEGGESQDVVAPVLVGESDPTPAPEPAMGSVWSGRATDRFEVVSGVWSVAEADLVFTLDPESDPDFLYYQLTGGTMSYSVVGTTPEGCGHSGSAQVGITPETARDTAGFYIRMSASPPTFEGSVHVFGHVFEVQTCDGPYSTRAQGIFIHVFSDEARPVVGDRISGSSLYGDKTFDISRVE